MSWYTYKNDIKEEGFKIVICKTVESLTVSFIAAFDTSLLDKPIGNIQFDETDIA